MSASREKRNRLEEKAKDALNPTHKNKKQQEASRRAVVTIIASVFVLGLIALFIIGTGLIPANIAVMIIDGEKITAAEFNYHYISAYQYEMNNYGMLYYYSMYYDVSDPFALESVMLSEDMSAEQYVKEQAETSIKSTVAQSKQAKNDGIELTSEQRDAIANSLTYVEQLADANNMSVKKVLEKTYGRGMSMKIYERTLERSMYSQAFANKELKSYVRSDEDLEAYLQEHREDFEYASYHTFSFDRTLTAGEGEEEPTEEAKTAYDEAQKAKAEEMLARVAEGADFKALSLEFTPVEDEAEDEDAEAEDGEDAADEDAAEDEAEEEEAEEETDDTLKPELLLSEVSDEGLKEFLMDESRKAGDKTIIETDSAYQVVLFVERTRMLYNTIDARHILVSSTDTTAEAARADAQSLLDEWKAGDATQDSFAALATEKSADTGSVSTGGLYEKMYKGQMVATFNDWIFDESRKAGDTGLVDTDYGTHVMYFVGQNEAYWRVQVKNAMDSEQYNARVEELVGAMDVKTSNFGMTFTI